MKAGHAGVGEPEKVTLVRDSEAPPLTSSPPPTTEAVLPATVTLVRNSEPLDTRRLVPRPPPSLWAVLPVTVQLVSVSVSVGYLESLSKPPPRIPACVATDGAVGQRGVAVVVQAAAAFVCGMADVPDS